MKRSRPGARGIPKVKTGCQTCRIRHKKCDEAKPACFQCVDTQRACDFLSLRPNAELSQKPCIELGDRERLHFDYFKDVCIHEFSLYFEDPMWERIILQIVSTELCMQHAALAIGALSRSQYHPEGSRHAALEYSTRQYNLAIQTLRRRLDSSPNYELAVLACLFFIHMEMLQTHGNKVKMLLRTSSAMLGSRPRAELDCLWIALSRINTQLSAFLDIQGYEGCSLAPA
ncbi:hypothetical protein BDZ45DRAFT_433268 [Acephala macrosclerotiorum]|nr:hypothetical protein BDZ45DRAFT_433268 [Acephala macrosclerotiorum]